MKTLFYLLISATLVNAYAVKPEAPKTDPKAKTAPKKTETKKAEPKAKAVPKKSAVKSKTDASTEKEKARLLELEKISKKAIVIIKGKSGSGTGFVTIFKGKKVIITNNHVIKGNDKLTFLTQSGKELKVKHLFIPKDRDLAIFELEDNSITPLQICTKVDELKSSTQVVVYGNSLGASVITTVKGTLQGTGPRDIETNAGFVNGNSGSPIIDLSTGKVIGVATYMTYRSSWTTYGTKFKIRRFGTRIDNITWDDFQKYNKKRYKQDIYMLEKLENSVRIAYAFLKYFNRYYGEEPDEFGAKLREKIRPLHCRMDKDMRDIPELKLVYRSWNLKFKSNQDRLESAIRSQNTRRQQPKKSFKFSAFNDDRKIQTDVHLLLDFYTNYMCMKHTIPRLIANGRKRLKKKPLHYEFFKRKGEKLLEIEAKLTKDYKKMMKNLTIIYKAKK